MLNLSRWDRLVEQKSIDRPNWRIHALLIGASFRTAPLIFREKLTNLINGDEDLFSDIHGVFEHTSLITCNRDEMYVITDDPVAFTEQFYKRMAEKVGEFKVSYFYTKVDYEVVHHVFTVACGLDSMLPGEEQIMAQIRRAEINGRAHGHVKSIISSIFDSSINTARKLRNLYRLNSGSSIGKFVADFIKSEIGDARGQRILLMGTSKTIRLIMDNLRERSSAIYLATRRGYVPPSFREAVLTDYKSAHRVAANCDIIISATDSGEYLLSKADLEGHGSKVLFDLAVPRNLDPAIGDIPGVELYNLDDLSEIMKDLEVSDGTGELKEALEYEARSFFSWLIATRLSGELASLYIWAYRIGKGEVGRALRRMPELTSKQKSIIHTMGKRMVGKLLLPPTNYLRASDSEKTVLEKIGALKTIYGGMDVEN